MAPTSDVIVLPDKEKLRCVDARSRIQNLPSELLAKIFHSLGMKQTAQLQCVCKRWFELFHQQNFIRVLHSQCLYLQTEDEPKVDTVFSTNLTNLIRNGVSVIQFDCVSLSRTGDGYIAGSANGILCVQPISHWHPSYTLCCGLTPGTPQMSVNDSKWLSNMPPVWFLYLFGFGYESRECDYKIFYLSFSAKKGESNKIGRVYSLKHNSWKDVEYPYKIGPRIVFYSSAKYSNDALYWLIPNGTGGHLVQRYDLYKDEFTSSTLLVLPAGTPEHVRLTILNGDIAVYSLDKEVGKFDLWIPESRGSAERSDTEFSWTKLVSLLLPELKSKILVGVTHLSAQQEVVLFVRGELASDRRKLLALWYHLNDRKTVRIGEVVSTLPPQETDDVENMLTEGEGPSVQKCTSKMRLLS